MGRRKCLPPRGRLSREAIKARQAEARARIDLDLATWAAGDVPGQWFYVAYERDGQLLGGCIVEAPYEIAASVVADMLKCNPGGRGDVHLIKPELEIFLNSENTNRFLFPHESEHTFWHPLYRSG
jgi:hypothetical protein